MLVNKVKNHVESHEVQEQEWGTYIFPNEAEFESSWAIWLLPDGSAHIYTKRNSKTGAFIGKPIMLEAPKRKPSQQLEDLLILCDNPEELKKLIDAKSGKHFKIVFS